MERPFFLIATGDCMYVDRKQLSKDHNKLPAIKQNSTKKTEFTQTSECGFHETSLPLLPHHVGLRLAIGPRLCEALIEAN
jgi:hypothetical protein